MSEHETLRERLVAIRWREPLVSSYPTICIPIEAIEQIEAVVQAELAVENAKLRELVQRMKPFYLRHTSDCSFDLMNSSPNSDYCDCGLAKRRSLLAESAQ